MERQWDDLRIFLELARTRGVATAARSLDLSEATVRRRLLALERQIGVSLFERSEGVFALTGAGAQLLPTIESMEQHAREGLEKLTDGDRRIAGMVRVGVPDGIAAHLLAPSLADFQQDHPDLDIELVSLTREVDFRRHEADIAIAWDRPEHGEHRISALRPVPLRLYAARAYLDRSPAVGSLDDLRTHRFVGYPRSAQIAHGIARVLDKYDLNVRLAFTSSSILVQASAANRGHGIVLLPHYIASEYDQLQAVIPEALSISMPLWLLVHKEMFRLARVEAVAKVVRGCFARL